jgi:hypothetical protein
MRIMSKRILIIFLLLLSVTAACEQEESATPTLEAEPDTAAPEPTTTVSAAEISQVALVDGELFGRIGISPNQVSLNTQGLPHSWQANAVAGSPYDGSQPPGPKDFPATSEGAQEVCLETTTTYRLRALRSDGKMVIKEVKIKVNAPVAVQLPS